MSKKKQEACHFLLELTIVCPGHRFHLGSEELIQNYMNCVIYWVKGTPSSQGTHLPTIYYNSEC